MGDVAKVFAINVAAVAGVIVGFGLDVMALEKMNKAKAKKRTLDDRNYPR